MGRERKTIWEKGVAGGMRRVGSKRHEEEKGKEYGGMNIGRNGGGGGQGNAEGCMSMGR